MEDDIDNLAGFLADVGYTIAEGFKQKPSFAEDAGAEQMLNFTSFPDEISEATGDHGGNWSQVLSQIYVSTLNVTEFFNSSEMSVVNETEKLNPRDNDGKVTARGKCSYTKYSIKIADSRKIPRINEAT